MKNKFALIILLLLIIGLIIFFYPKKYEVYEINNFEPRCEHYIKECKCFGSLTVMFSLPPQYSCLGFTSCKSVDYYSPENCRG